MAPALTFGHWQPTRSTSLINSMSHNAYPVFLSSLPKDQAPVHYLSAPSVQISQSKRRIEKDLREYFPPSSNSCIFYTNGRHDPDWPEFITDFIALPIYEHVHKVGKKFRPVRIMKTIWCKIRMNCLLVAWYSGMLKRLTIVSMIAHKDRRVDRRTWFLYGMSFRSMLSKS